MGHILERCSTVFREKIKGLFYTNHLNISEMFSKSILKCSRIIQEHL